MKKALIYFLLIFCTLSHFQSFSQGKEANIWYFGWGAGIDFNQGTPPAALTNSQMYIPTSDVSGSAVISDSNGSLLFYSDGITIWNKDHQFMQNGQYMGDNSTQGAMIIPKPGSNHLYYYFFNFALNLNTWESDFQYSIIDMTLDNGLGGVVDNQKELFLFSNSSFHLSAVKNETNDNIWVLTHGYMNNEYYAFKITEDSLHITPVISQTGSIFQSITGYMKISPNGEKVATANANGPDTFFEILDFDSNTGLVSDTNLVHEDGSCIAVEFSPDNTRLYATRDSIYQYNLEAGSPSQILASKVGVSDDWTDAGALQIGPDGKVYCCLGTEYYLSVINEPNELGLECDFVENVIYLEGKQTTGGLPSFIQSYLNDPTFSTQNNCVGDATLFEITETNGIDSVFWKFNDFPNMPNDTSTLFIPSYTFSHAGTYNVELTVYSNLLQKTVTQEVIIHPLPEPNLGNDTLFCDTCFSITLNANCEGDFFTWSTGLEVPEITVSDTGIYWVNVYKNGCSNRDTIYIGLYPILQIDSIQHTNDHCLQALATLNVFAQETGTGEISYSIDGGNTYYQNGGEFINLPVGDFYVTIKDENDCQNVYINNPIIIENIYGPQVNDVQITSASGGMNNGAINIFASGNGDTLFYSNDNGTNFQINDGLFNNLFAGFYSCIVMDKFGCDTTFIIEVTEEITVYLQAIAGDDEVCPGNSAFVPLIVSNFNDVGSFKTTLLYNKNLLTCVGFANAQPQLEDSLEALLFPAEGKIELKWSSSAVSLPDNTNIADLIFQSIDPGMSLVEWNGSTGASYFYNSTGLNIPVNYTTGNVKIYQEVSFLMFGSNEVCEGEMLELSPLMFSSNGDVTFLWTDPNGNTNTNETLTINNIQSNQSGIYSLTVTDTLNCQANTSEDVIVFPTPSPAFANQNTIITKDPLDLDAGSGFLYYLWNTGDSTQIITINNDGWYFVEIESQQGCVGEDSVYVLFEPIRIFLPNAFTPDNNGLNDEFKVLTYLENIEYFKMLIYNRWGALIFQSNDITQGWGGKYKGKLCPQGTYIYKIQYSLYASSTGQSETKMGTVVLLR